MSGKETEAETLIAHGNLTRSKLPYLSLCFHELYCEVFWSFRAPCFPKIDRGGFYSRSRRW